MSSEIHDPNAEDSAEVVVRSVEEQIEAWRRALLELAGGSALWDIDSLGDAVVDLTGAHPSGIAQLYAGRRTRLSNVVREGASLSQARRQARLVLSRADELAGQFGLAPTYVAMGVARWFEPEDLRHVRTAIDPTPIEGHHVQVPVLLRPIRMRPLPANDIEMELDPQVEINPVIVRALRLAGVTFDPDILTSSTSREHGFTPRPALDAIETLGTALAEFSMDSRIIVGTFVHPGQALAEDVDEQREALAEHTVVRALAGSDRAAEDVRRSLPAIRLTDPDPDSERGVGDLDSAQHQVLDALASGSDFYIDAAPGVDTAGTVAAMIAEVAKNGSSMLYVPGTRRAGAAVVDAARRAGIDSLILDISGDPQWRKNAADHIVDGMNPTPPEISDEVKEIRADLRSARKILGDFIGALHLPREPWGVSANRVLHELANLTSQRPGPRTQVRLPSETVYELTPEEREEARATLERAAELGTFRLRASDTPWYGAELRDAEHAERALEQVRNLVEKLPLVHQQMAATAAQTGLDEATNLAQWSEQLELLDGISRSLDMFTPEAFERPAREMVAATATSKWRAEHGISLPRSVIRRLKKRAKDLVRPGVVVDDLHQALADLSEQRETWRKHCSGGGWPRAPENLYEITSTFETVGRDVDELQQALVPKGEGNELREMPVADLLTRMQRLASDEDTLNTIPARAQALADLGAWGFGALCEDLSHRRVATDIVGAEFDLAWWSSVLEEMLTVDSAMVALDPKVLDDGLARLRASDEAHVASLTAPVLAAHAERMRGAIREHRSEAQEFYRGVKHRGELDLRTLVADYPNIIWRPRPTWIVPPMVIPQALPAGAAVDVVILDAVHHLGIEYLLPAIVRGKQVIVIGDLHREGALGADPFSVLPQIELPADRVDRAAPLSQFLRDHGYDESIQPVPSPPQVEHEVITLDLVDGVGAPALDSEVVESVQAEVDRVVDLAIDHALTRPEESLAIVALNSRHADRVRKAIAALTNVSPAIASFFRPENNEAFAVVSAEAAAGLRCDAVILTVGFGKTPHGRVLHRFGAISGEGGAGFLIDAIGASRKRLTVVSSFSSGDLDPGRLRSRGAQMLYDLLALAEAGVEPAHVDDSAEREPDRLLLDLAERLWRLGITVVPQYGEPGWYRIPLALGHPSRPGELLMALLTDDAAYTTESSLRRRDRHWPQRLESRGWHVRTVYSTAVFMDPQGEAERIAAEVTALAEEGREETPEPVTVPEEVLDGAEDLLTAAENAPEIDETQAPEPAKVTVRSETIAGQTTSHIPVIVEAGERSPRPDIEKGLPITTYSDDQLDELASWIGSDGKERSPEQYMIELREELGITREGAHIDTVLGAVIERTSAPVKKKPRRATRVGTEDPEFSESAWRAEDTEAAQEPLGDDDDRILREKPPHWS